MSDFLLQFNVFGANWFDDSREKSGQGHINVTFINLITGEKQTFGANVEVDAGLGGLLSRGYGNKRDGMIQREDEKLALRKNVRVSRSAPVSKEQFFKILNRVQSVENMTYDYSVLPGIDGRAQACASFANAIYRMTGHRHQVGALFSGIDRKRVGGAVWAAIPTFVPPEVNGGIFPNLAAEEWTTKPLYEPKSPVTAHVPDTSNLGLKLHEDRGAAGKRKDGKGVISDAFTFPDRNPDGSLRKSGNRGLTAKDGLFRTPPDRMRHGKGRRNNTILTTPD